MTKAFKLDESLSIVIPAYKEEGNLIKTVTDTVLGARKVSNDFEVVIINDGSPDRTGEIADNLAKKYKEVKAFHHNKNRGLATAWKTGIKNSKKTIILYIEGDGQQPFTDQIELLKKIKNADLVLGVRSHRFDYTPLRMIFSWGYLALIFLLFRLTYKDVGWSQAYRKKIFNKIKMNSITPFFDTEVIIKAKRFGYRVTSAKSFYKPRKAGSTSLGNFRTAYQMFVEALKMRFGLLG